MVDTNAIADIYEDGRRIKTNSQEHLRVTEEALKAVASEFAASGAGVGILKLPPPVAKDCMQAARQLAVSTPEARGRISDADPVTQNCTTASPRRWTASSPCRSPMRRPGAVCAPLVDGEVLRWDGTHFTGPGALLVAPSLGSQIEAILAARP